MNDDQREKIRALREEGTVKGGARVAYQTDRWGGVPGRLHFEIHMEDGGVSQVTIDAAGFEIFAPRLLTIDAWGLSINACKARFVSNGKDVNGRHLEALAERDRCRQLFLAWAENHFDWKIKDESDERHIREMLEAIDSGEEPAKRLRLVDSDPAAQGLPTIREEES